MKKRIFLLLQIISILTSLAQEKTHKTNPNNITRQGFGTQVDFQIGQGFVNPKVETDGTPYYFDDWDTEGIIYSKDKGKYKIKKVNINLYDNTLEAFYGDGYVFTFFSKNLIKIIINTKVFRVIKVNKKSKIFELFFNDKFSIYRYYNISYSEHSINPMVNRKVNKYIQKAEYYLYSENKLTKIKLSKNSFSKLFQSDKISQQSIYNFIKENRLSLSEETDLIKVLNFVN